VDLFELISNRPITESPLDAPTCPFCQSKDVEHNGSECTTVGGDNHFWRGCNCRRCGKQFTREHKGGEMDLDFGMTPIQLEKARQHALAFRRDEAKWARPNVWYTQRTKGEPTRILLGLPSCCESSYVYNCARCSGPMRQHFNRAAALAEPRSDQASSFRVYTIEIGKPPPMYTYKCDRCSNIGEAHEFRMQPS
jgi:hypothetical protein